MGIVSTIMGTNAYNQGTLTALTKYMNPMSKSEYTPPEENGFHWSPIEKNVTLWCPTKKIYLCAPLCAPIQLNVNSNWVDVFGNENGIMGGAMNIMDTINSFKTMANGSSIKAPWMSRQVWKGTSPRVYKLSMNFVNQGEGGKYIAACMQSLLALVAPYCNIDPGKAEKNANGQAKYLDGGFGADAGKIDWLSLQGIWDTISGFVTGAVSVVKSIADTALTIPGPALTALSKDKDNKDAKDVDVNKVDVSNVGAPVIVRIGSFETLPLCYITSIDVQASKNLDSFGQPQYIKATLTVRKADMDVVGPGGMLLDTSQSGSAMAGMINYVDTMITRYKDDLKTAGGNFKKGFDKGAASAESLVGK